MFAPYDYRRESATQPDRSKLFYVFMNSTALYVLAYIILYSLNQLVTSEVALVVDIKSIIYYHKIDFRVPADFWNAQRVIYTFFSGPLISLLLAIVSFRIYKFLKKRPGFLKLFFFWLYLHGCNLFFGAYVAGVVTTSNFHWATHYMRASRKVEFGIAFFCVLVMFTIGYFATRGFIQMSPSQSLIERFSRRAFVFAVCILPWIVGSGILTLFKLPNITINEMLVYLMMFTIAVPVALVQRNFLEVNLVKQIKALGFSWVFLIATVGALVLFRSIFQFGLRIG